MTFFFFYLKSRLNLLLYLFNIPHDLLAFTLIFFSFFMFEGCCSQATTGKVEINNKLLCSSLTIHTRKKIKY